MTLTTLYRPLQSKPGTHQSLRKPRGDPDHVVAWISEADGWRPVTDVGFGHEQFAIYVWRSVREGGDTKTDKSRRTLKLPDRDSHDRYRCHSPRRNRAADADLAAFSLSSRTQGRLPRQDW